VEDPTFRCAIKINDFKFIALCNRNGSFEWFWMENGLWILGVEEG